MDEALASSCLMVATALIVHENISTCTAMHKWNYL